MWRFHDMRARLSAHWTDQRHPYHHRSQANRALIEEVLSSEATPFDLDQEQRKKNTTLRCLARENPPVFGSFF
jgi:hypothetical protein